MPMIQVCYDENAYLQDFYAMDSHAQDLPGALTAMLEIFPTLTALILALHVKLGRTQALQVWSYTIKKLTGKV